MSELETRWADEVGEWTVCWDADGMPLSASVASWHQVRSSNATVSFVKVENGLTTAGGPDRDQALWYMTCALVQFIAGHRGAACWLDEATQDACWACHGTSGSKGCWACYDDDGGTRRQEHEE